MHFKSSFPCCMRNGPDQVFKSQQASPAPSAIVLFKMNTSSCVDHTPERGRNDLYKGLVSDREELNVKRTEGLERPGVRDHGAGRYQYRSTRARAL
ncbi:hypothetical protein TREES_T100012129 [Tupaia chinensis]|uniref:Uncharacterized protein n=1 Tax=Tupaia chinensis TaxID=246437 RepID=L9K3P0_TUPCH|nr:hypothetical protein TREES_T100012129 [Tupaia chinensis]